MFQELWNWTKGVLSKMGLITKIEQVTDHKNIPIDDTYYSKILAWKALYQGYYDKIHNVKFKTVVNGENHRRLATLNMPKTAAQELATIIFNERCEISISDSIYNENIQNVFKNNSFNSNFQQYLEYMFAMGGMVVKPYVVDDEIKLSYVTADCFLPITWTNSRVTEGVFISSIKKKNKNYTHLEWHTFEGKQYVIKNELYESNNTNDLGVKVALSILYPELDEEVRIDNVNRPLFAYFKPNLANNFDTTIPLGVAVFSNAIDTIKSIDIAFDSFQREFRLGRKRIIVPTTAIREVIDPLTGKEHRYFDATDETYEAFNIGDMDAEKIQEISSTLRVGEHVSAINALLNLFAMQIGFSSGAFSFDGQSMKTATEVVSENSKTFRTKQSHENVIEQGITDLIDCIGVVAELYNIFQRPKEYEVTVTFDDSIAEDQTAEINKQVLLITNGLQSKLRAIMKIYGLTEEEAQQLLDEINTERAVQTENIDFFGMNKNNVGGN